MDFNSPIAHSNYNNSFAAIKRNVVSRSQPALNVNQGAGNSGLVVDFSQIGLNDSSRRVNGTKSNDSSQQNQPFGLNYVC